MISGVQGQALGDLDAGEAGGDGAPGAPVFGGSVGLGVVGLEVAGAAVHPDQDDGLGLARAWA